MSLPYARATLSASDVAVLGTCALYLYLKNDVAHGLSIRKSLKLTASRYCPLWGFPFGLPLKVFKTRLLERSFHTVIKRISFSSPIDVGSHNSAPFRAQRHRWLSFLYLIDVGPHQIYPSLGKSLLAGTSPSVWL